MRSKKDLATDKAREGVQRVYDLCMEIIAIMDEGADELALMSSVGSSYGLEVWAHDRATPVVVPDGWINDWAVYCNGNKEFVVQKVRDLCRWSLDNPKKRKHEKSLRRWLGARIAEAWTKDMASRPVAAGSLRGYDRRHGGA